MCLAVLVSSDLGARGMTLTPLPLAVRGGSGDLAGTVEGAHPTEDRTEALMPETAAGSMEARGLGPLCSGCQLVLPPFACWTTHGKASYLG